MVSVVIANHNGAHFLKDCLSSLRQQVYRDIEIIVVDNASEDNSVDFLRKNYPDVKIIQNTENLGFAGANNRGFKAALGEYVLFLNNDTKIDKFFLKRLLDRISDRGEEVGVVFSKLLLLNEPDRLDAIGSYLTDFGFLYHIGFQEIDKGQYDNLKEIFSPKGVCFLVPKKILLEIGGFDEDYFSYFEESDFFWRVWLLGKKITFVPESVVYHKVGGTSTRLPSAYIDFHSFKNRICTLIKNLGTSSLLRILPVHILLCLGVSFLYLCTLRIKNSFAVLKALGWNLCHLNSSLRKRRFVQKHIRKIKDEELLKEIRRDISLFHFVEFTKIYLKRW